VRASSPRGVVGSQGIVCDSAAVSRRGTRQPTAPYLPMSESSRKSPNASLSAGNCRSEQTYYRWRNQFGGLQADDAKKLKELEQRTPR
jgi:putative transposase